MRSPVTPLLFDSSHKSKMATLSLFASATDSRIDAENGIIRGVRVITKGECKGHSFLGEPMIVDDQTISEVVEAAASFKDGVPVKLAHGTDIEELVGAIRDIVADGDCARGDLYLLKSHENYETIIEMATTMPSNFGISISFMNAPEPVKGADMEPDGDEDDADESLRNLVGDDIVAYAARVCELYSADLVANPATGDRAGLFSAIMEQVEPTEAPAEAAPEVVKVEEVAPAAEAPSETPAPEAPEAEEVKEELSEEIHAPEAPVEEVPAEESVAAGEEVKEEAPAEIPAPEELSRKFDGFRSDFEATKTELSRVNTELASVRSELQAAQEHLAIKEAKLVELNMLHRSVLSVMGLAPSIEIPVVSEEAPVKSIIEQYEAMPAGPERLSFFKANRREIERSIEGRLAK